VTKDKAGKINSSLRLGLSNLLKKRKLIVFAVFVLIAALLWFFNALDKTYESSVNKSVRFKNLPEQKALRNNLVKELEIGIKGYGYHLLQLKLQKDRIPIVIDLNNYNINQLDSKPDVYYIVANQLINNVQQRFNSQITCVSIKPDTIYFNYSNIISKKIPVYTNIDYSIDSKYMLTSNLCVEPDSVVISGPQDIVENTDMVETKFRDIGVISGNVNENIKLNVNEHLQYSTSSVKISISSEKFSEKLVNTSIKIINVPDSVLITTIPKTVDLIFRVPISKYSEVNNGNFEVNGDFSSAKDGMIKLNIVSAPEDVSDLRMNPSEVRFIVDDNN
jgi:YbbR domain-containing protein